MTRVLHQIMWGFLALFGLGVIVVIAYQLLYTGPEQRCLAGHGWWEPSQRVCGTPVYLPAITGKPNKPRPPSGRGRRNPSDQELSLEFHRSPRPTKSSTPTSRSEPEGEIDPTPKLLT